MRVASKVRLHIECLLDSELFTTRDLLYCGSRNAVDIILHRLVRQRVISRLARGVFIKERRISRWPSVYEIAKAKSAAFGKTIIEHGLNSARLVGLCNLSKLPAVTNIFYSSGASSSFVSVYGVISFQGVSSRKLNLGSSDASRLLRGLWHLGHAESAKRRGWARYIKGGFSPVEIRQFRKLLHSMPVWIQSLFLMPNNYWKPRQSYSNIFRPV